jgi:pyrimidine operon attenuation protein/uracil phosphoribosyltransferase
MIRGVAFASCYIYSPAGANVICKCSRLMRALLKAGDAQFMQRYAARVRQQVEQATQLAGYFLPQDVLVPVPGSTPKAGGIWVAAELAQALVQAGLGSKSWPGLRRISAVRKSATAVQGARPTVALHYQSFRIEQPPFCADSVVLIDDVVTRGRTLLAAAARAREAFPDAQIRTFALLRTMGFLTDIPRLLEPCRGEIRWRAGDARRIP